MITPTRQPSLAEDYADVVRRLRNLETMPTVRIYQPTVNAGGAAWNAGNGAWVDPTGQPEYTELRVANTPSGSQIWRNLHNGTNLAWRLIA